jgi:hypothetical protein
VTWALSASRTAPPWSRGRRVRIPWAVVPSFRPRYGGPEVLRLTRRPRSRPGEGQVLVRVHAASVNARDWHVMRGEPRLARLMDRTLFAGRRPRIATRGTDLAGVVEAVGDDVTAWQPGDAVFGEGIGTFADYAVASAEQLAALPAGTSFHEAAALSLAATTALLCLDEAALGRDVRQREIAERCDSWPDVPRRFPRVGRLDQDALVPQPPERGVTIVVGVGRGVPEAVRPRVSRLVAALRNLRTWPNPRFSRCCTTSCTPPPCPQRVQRKAGSDHWRETSLSPLYAGHRRLSHVVPSIERRLR